MILRPTLLLLLLIAQNVLAQERPNPDPKRFADDIRRFEEWDSKNSFPEDAILFVGSSSIRMWKTAEAFPEFSVINRGFGGSEISDVIHYYDRVIKPYAPKAIVFYCGDNDINSGKSPKQVFGDFSRLVALLKDDFPQVRLLYVPAKPSLARWHLWEKMNEVNLMIRGFCEVNSSYDYVDTASPMIPDGNKPSKDLFIEDGLHLSDKGYAMWNKVLGPYLKDRKTD